jgi:hypothetical protein
MLDDDGKVDSDTASEFALEVFIDKRRSSTNYEKPCVTEQESQRPIMGARI